MGRAISPTLREFPDDVNFQELTPRPIRPAAHSLLARLTRKERLSRCLMSGFRALIAARARERERDFPHGFVRTHPASNSEKSV